MSKKFILISLFALASVAGAQSFTIGSNTWTDISTTGGTAIAGVGDDTSHSITTTIGNGMFPAGNTVRVHSNGVATSGNAAATVSCCSAAAIPASGVPTGMTTGCKGYLVPFYSDLYAIAGTTQVYWQEAAGVLTIMWKNIGHFSGAVATQVVSFEVLIYQGPQNCTGPSLIQYIYNDTVFGGTHAQYDNGLLDAVGYATTVPGLVNAPYSYNQAVLSAGLCLDLTAPVGNFPGYNFFITSPGGPGTVQLDIFDCSGAATGYFIPYTTAAGVFPAGWLYGLDIDVQSMVNIYSSGYPFVGSLPFSIGASLPSGFQFWMAAIGLNGSNTPIVASTKTYTIP